MATPRTVNYVLTEAIYKSLQDRQFQAPIQGSYLEVALRTLESLFDEWRDKIPFAQQFTFNNVDELTDTNFVSVQNVNYILPARNQMPLRRVDRDEFYNIQNIIGLKGLPQVWWFDELEQTIHVYPEPQNPNYQFIVWGRPAMSAMQPSDLLPDNMPTFMITAITYELAFRLCSEYGVPWDEKKEMVRQQLLLMLDKKKTIDLKPQIMKIFKTGGNTVPPFPYYFYLWGGQ